MITALDKPQRATGPPQGTLAGSKWQGLVPAGIQGRGTRTGGAVKSICSASLQPCHRAIAPPRVKVTPAQSRVQAVIRLLGGP